MGKKALIVIGLIMAFSFTRLSAQPPVAYDLRDYDLVTSVKAQEGGTCWAHAIASGLESDLLRTGNWEDAGEEGDPNMSEYHLSWWMGFNQEWNGDFQSGNPDGLEVHNWGDFKMFCAYMSRLDGPVREIDAPGDGDDNYSFSNQPALFDLEYRRWYVQDVNWYYVDGDGPMGSLEYIDSIKYEVMSYGICPTNYLAFKPVMTGSYNGLKSYYLPDTSSAGPNHNVSIIGWDDNASTPYREDGAWLCKNSWGDNTQYLWISYWDKHCCRHIDESAVSFREVRPVPYANVYFHDYHGWRDELETASECFNKFIADNSEDEYLVDVSFFTLAFNEEWEIKVYDNYLNGELQDELASASGKVFAMGYHTRALNKPVTLADGDDFYIYLKVTNGGLAYDRTSSPFNAQDFKRTRGDAVVPAKSEPDQSYYRTSPGSEWTDLYDHEETITANGQVIDCQGTQNFCLKGYTVDTSPVGTEFTPASLGSPAQLCNYPNPFSSHTRISYRVPPRSTASLEIVNAKGYAVYSMRDAIRDAGMAKFVWNGMDKHNNPLPSGLYYAILTVKAGAVVSTEKRRMFLMK